MTVQNALLFLLAIATTSTCWLAISARRSSTPDSRSTRSPKAPDLPESSTLAEVLRRLQDLEADQVALSSTLEKLCTTTKRLTSRAGMREHRSNDLESSPPPVGASKADLLRHYGMSGKIGPEFARAQQELEFKTRSN